MVLFIWYTMVFLVGLSTTSYHYGPLALRLQWHIRLIIHRCIQT